MLPALQLNCVTDRKDGLMDLLTFCKEFADFSIRGYNFHCFLCCLVVSAVRNSEMKVVLFATSF